MVVVFFSIKPKHLLDNLSPPGFFSIFLVKFMVLLNDIIQFHFHFITLLTLFGEIPDGPLVSASAVPIIVQKRIA